MRTRGCDTGEIRMALLDAPAGDVRKGTSCFELNSPGGYYYCFSQERGPEDLPEPLPRRVPPFFSSFAAQPSQSTSYTSAREHRSSSLCPVIIYMLMKNPRKGATFEASLLLPRRTYRRYLWCRW